MKGAAWCARAKRSPVVFRFLPAAVEQVLRLPGDAGEEIEGPSKPAGLVALNAHQV
jgi:hypothetical protein